MTTSSRDSGTDPDSGGTPPGATSAGTVPPGSPLRPAISLHLTALDTPDPAGLAEFWAAVLGGEVTRTDEDWHEVTAGGSTLAFQLAPDHVPPTWPDNAVPQQLHLDLRVTDLDAAEDFVLLLGATKLPSDVDPDGFRVFADPAGHPFCLCAG